MGSTNLRRSKPQRIAAVSSTRPGRAHSKLTLSLRRSINAGIVSGELRRTLKFFGGAVDSREPLVARMPMASLKTKRRLGIRKSKLSARRKKKVTGVLAPSRQVAPSGKAKANSGKRRSLRVVRKSGVRGRPKVRS